MASQKPEKKSESLATASKSEGPRVVYLALDVAERGQSTAVAVLQDLRTELRAGAEGAIDLAEKLAAGTVRFARKLVQKLDEASTDALKGTERALHDSIEDARETARVGKQLAERAVDKVTEKVTGERAQA
jgi:hypothetical protein